MIRPIGLICKVSPSPSHHPIDQPGSELPALPCSEHGCRSSCRQAPVPRQLVDRPDIRAAQQARAWRKSVEKYDRSPGPTRKPTATAAPHDAPGAWPLHPGDGEVRRARGPALVPNRSKTRLVMTRGSPDRTAAIISGQSSNQSTDLFGRLPRCRVERPVPATEATSDSSKRRR